MKDVRTKSGKRIVDSIELNNCDEQQINHTIEKLKTKYDASKGYMIQIVHHVE